MQRNKLNAANMSTAGFAVDSLAPASKISCQPFGKLIINESYFMFRRTSN